jgi:hypothetical protein
MQELATLARQCLDIEASGAGGASTEATINDIIARTALAAGVDLVV